MKKLLLIIFFISMLSNYAFTQSTWQNTFINNSNAITKIIPRDSLNYLAFSSNCNSYLKTTNAGANWASYKFTDSSVTISDGQFINAQTGWLLGSTYYTDFFLFKTTNNGANWNLQNYRPAQTSVGNLFFINEFTGFITGGYYNSINHKMMLKTTNGGVNWVQYDFGVSGWLSRIRFINSTTGFVIGTYYFGKTTDSGNNWVNIITGTPFENKNILDFWTSDGLNIWIIYCGSNPDLTGYFYNTTNGGINWNLKYTYSTAAEKYFDDILFINNQTGFACGIGPSYDRNVIMTTNSGNNWFNSFQNLIYNPYELVYFNNSVLVGGGSNFLENYILKSTNIGANWSYFERNKDIKMLDVHFKDNNNGFAIDAHKIYKTTNCGQNWNLIYQNDSIQFVKIAFSDSTAGLINLYSANQILRTSNNGLNWSLINMPRNISFIKYLNNSLVHAFGGSTEYKSTNGGLNWDSIYTFSYYPTDISFINDSVGWLLCETVIAYPHYPSYYYTQILKTTDKCSTWNLVFYNYSTNNSTYFFRKLKFFDNNNGVTISGPGNSFFKTTNGGINWFACNNFGNNIYGYNLHMVNQNTGWMFGTYNNIYKTTNAGLNWMTFPFPIVNSMFSLDSNNLWFASENDGLYHTTDGGGFISAVSFNNNKVIQSYKLFQNYPNPFNPVTRIDFEIPKSDFVKIKVYDILGREIQILLNQNLKPGRYSIIFNGDGLPSGIYFYRLITGDFTETKKMVLIK